MKLPPALTWLHLFPADASFECDADAQWMCAQIDSLDAKPTGNGMRVRVGGNGFGDGGGCIGINSRIRDRDLQKAGFTYIRRFAVLPDMKTARWFVPLDAAAISAAAFSLYSPARFSARLKVAAARLATYSPLRIWYRDEMVIAQKSPPPLECKLAELFPRLTFRLALSSGAPEPARNRKVSAAVIGMDGRIVGFAKLAGSDLSRRLLEDESRLLPQLTKRNVASPQLMYAGEVDGTFMTLQQPLPGWPVSLKLAANKLALLDSLRSGRMVRASETNLVATLPARIAALPIARPELRDALTDLLPVLEQTRVPSTIVHGDFAPWNLREHRGKVSAFDWEYAELDGLPFVDQTHYQLQVGYLLEKWNLSQACAALAEVQAKNDLSLPAESVKAIQMVYLIDNLTRLFSEGYDETENEMVAWYCKLLEKLASPSRRGMVAA